MLPPHLDPTFNLVTPRARKLAIIARVASAHGVSVKDILAQDRADRIVAARRAAMVAIREVYPQMTLHEMARLFDRDHTTVLYSLREEKQRAVRRFLGRTSWITFGVASPLV